MRVRPRSCSDTFWLSLAVQRASPDHRENHFLTRLVDRLPRQRDQRADSYLDLLDQALIDRHISVSEADGLVDLAEVLGLSRSDVADLHQQYLVVLVRTALADGVITPSERNDLDAVAALLGLSPTSVGDACSAVQQGRKSGTDEDRQRWQLRAGDWVVFTGDMSPEREVWQQEASGAGLEVGHHVTKRTRLLIAADPDSMSGKAKKARQYGVPIVHPVAYKTLLRELRAPVSR